MYDVLIKNGKVVLEDQVAEIEVAIKDGKVAALGTSLGEAKEVVDAAGMYVLPGAVDCHMHFSDPGRESWEGFETGTKSLAKGGTTTYIDMPLNGLPAITNGYALNLKLETAKDRNWVDYAFYGGVTPYNLDKGEIKELHDGGVVGYKAFLSTCGDRSVEDDFQDVNDYGLYEGMSQLAPLNQRILVHCENATICDSLGAKAQREGRLDMAAYLDSRPIFSEVEAVQRALFFAKETGCKIHLVHLSCSEAVQAALKARYEDGVDVTIETCPHYLIMDRDDVIEIGPLAKCSPPIRAKEDVEQLWEEFFAGNIDAIGTDHSPCTIDLKEVEDGNMFKAWGGISGAQNLIDVMFDEAVQKRGMCPSQLMRTLATNAAKIFELPNKGKIEYGYDADIVLLKPNAPYVLKAEDLEYKNQHSPYVGREIGCQIMKTFVRGNLVYSQGEGIIGEATGTYITKN